MLAALAPGTALASGGASTPPPTITLADCDYSQDGAAADGYQALAAGPDETIWFLEDQGPIALARLDPQRPPSSGSSRGERT